MSITGISWDKDKSYCIRGFSNLVGIHKTRGFSNIDLFLCMDEGVSTTTWPEINRPFTADLAVIIDNINGDFVTVEANFSNP